MKILHVAETITGGVATVMNYLIEDQSEQFGPKNIKWLVPESQADELRAGGQCSHTFVRSGRNVRSILGFAVSYIRAIRADEPDVIHLHSSFAGVIGRLLAWTAKKPPKVVYCPHAWAFMMQSGELKKKLFAIIERVLQPLAHKIICVSNYEEKMAYTWGLSDSNIAVVHNGVGSEAPIAIKECDSERTINALYVGRFDYQKGFDVLSEAALHIDHKRIKITAIGSEVNDKAVARSPYIEHVGWIPHDQLTAWFDQADVVIVPSRWELSLIHI